MVAASLLIAIVTSIGFPRATSNASIGRLSRDAIAALDATVARDAIVALDGTAVLAVGNITWSRPCPIDWRQSMWHVKKLIRCAADHVGVSTRKALYIAWRESRYQPSAYNEEGRAAGIYQHLLRYWPDRADRYGFDGWSAFNARANIFVTMRMVHRIGWGPWALPSG